VSSRCLGNHPSCTPVELLGVLQACLDKTKDTPPGAWYTAALADMQVAGKAGGLCACNTLLYSYLPDSSGCSDTT